MLKICKSRCDIMCLLIFTKQFGYGCCCYGDESQIHGSKEYVITTCISNTYNLSLFPCVSLSICLSLCHSRSLSLSLLPLLFHRLKTIHVDKNSIHVFVNIVSQCGHDHCSWPLDGAGLLGIVFAFPGNVLKRDSTHSVIGRRTATHIKAMSIPIKHTYFFHKINTFIWVT